MIASLITAAALVCASPGVIDGDTLRCGDGVRIRLWGIQAPERHDPGGPAATRELAAIVKGRQLTCHPRGKSYERVVARCWVSPCCKRDVAGEMVRRGHAVDWPRYSNGFYRRAPR